MKLKKCRVVDILSQLRLIMSATLCTLKEVTALWTLKDFPVLYKNMTFIAILLKSDDFRMGSLILKETLPFSPTPTDKSSFFILKPKTASLSIAR